MTGHVIYETDAGPWCEDCDGPHVEVFRKTIAQINREIRTCVVDLAAWHRLAEQYGTQKALEDQIKTLLWLRDG